MARFIVTGIGRCGTSFIDAALRGNKFNSGHEQFFNPNRFVMHGNDVQEYKAREQVDVAWHAAPHLHLFHDLKVVHLVRNPIQVINSFVKIGFWLADRYNQVPQANFVRRFGNYPRDPLHASGFSCSDSGWVRADT